MQFEDFDKKIKEAADNHHPAYDEQAWAKMNKLLDKHLPEKDERRRRFAWLFFLLFLLGGAGIFYGVQSLVGKPAKLTVSAPSSERKDRVQETGATEITKEVPVTGNAAATIPTANGPAPDQPVLTKPVNNLPVAGEPRPFTAKGRTQTAGAAVIPHSSAADKKTIARKAGGKQGNEGSPVFQSGSAKKSKKQVTKPVLSKTDKSTSDPFAAKDVSVSGNEPVAIVPGNVVVSPEAIVPAPATITKASTIVQPKNDSVARDGEVVIAVTSPTKQKPSKQSYFFLTFSAGPDASYTRDGKPGRVIPVTGAGIGYLYKERISIRAGFYNAAKIYSAAPEAYKAPASFYNYYPFLVNVDANCRVYELPVSLGYHFGARKNHSWFASATLSSYLMKRETYNYSYKTSAWGAVQQRKWNLYNDNQHYFSILGISAGYQRKITERISFVAEPYLRVPVQGVGYGNVKLNSAGVLFSLAVQPAALLPRKQKK